MKMKYLLSVILIISIFVIPCFASTNLITQQDTTHPSQNIQVERWTIFQLKLDGPQTGNPFVDVSLTAEIKNGYNVYSPLGFYDGSGVYKIRFMPTETGEWSYITKSNRKELDGIKGIFTCVKALQNNHGPVRVRNKYYLAYEDGTPYFQIGTTCYAWAHQGDIMEQQSLKTLASAPFGKSSF